ncbi:MAG: DUF4339 domain-containing protein [Bdellovibrionota bacterium]
MNAKEPTWFVRIQGHTLGPLSSEELKAGLREGNVNLADKIIRSGENAWQSVGDHQELAAYWQNVRRPTPSFDIPSLNVLWKKPKPPIPVAPARPPAPAMPEAPLAPAMPAIPDPAFAKPLENVSEKPKAPQKMKAARVKKAALVLVEPTPVVVPVQPAPAAPAPKAEESPALEAPAPRAQTIEFRPAPEKSAVEKEIIQILETKKLEEEKAKAAIAVFPERPEVPEIFSDFDKAREPKKSKRDLIRKAEWKRILANKNLRIAAALALLIAVAGIAYWAGQKTRDLKELPLSDPSSPTTQPSTASDPIQPLRAPTRPQRD